MSGPRSVSAMRPLLERVVDRLPERPALIVDDSVTSFAELLELVDTAAALLAVAGVGPGDHVALADEADLLGVVTVLAAMERGAAAALMNPRLTAHELKVLREAAKVVELGVAGEQARVALEEAGSSTVIGLADIRASRGLMSTTVEADANTDALVLFTSGTTGTPKAIALTASMIRERVLLYSPEVDEAPMVTLACTPLAHVGGVMPILNSLAKGSTVVVQQRFDPGRWLELVDRHRVTNTFVVPTMLHRIVAHPTLSGRDLSSMQLLVFGAAPASPELIRRVQAAFPGAVVANTFGQTETMGSLTLFDPSDQRPERLASVGQPMPGVEARVVDPETGVDRPTGEVGELWVKTPTMVIPAEQRADPLLPEGWFRTGDLVSQDEEGYLYPMGRRADTINRAGEKFPPSEIEDVVRRHPAVVDVAVLGLPDDEMGMRVGVAAVVSWPLELDELRHFCEVDLAHFKLPERLLVLDELPYNDFGKVDRKAIRALAGT